MLNSLYKAFSCVFLYVRSYIDIYIFYMLMYIVVHIHAHAPANTYTHKKNKLIKEKYMYTSTLFFDQVSH